jgi:hypothetical protein
MSDTALMHATMVTSSIHRALIASKDLDQDYYHHRGMVIKLVSQRLQDPEVMPTDATICATLVILACEVGLSNLLRDACEERFADLTSDYDWKYR